MEDGVCCGKLENWKHIRTIHLHPVTLAQRAEELATASLAEDLLLHVYVLSLLSHSSPYFVDKKLR
jgi:hypothetical protein